MIFQGKKKSYVISEAVNIQEQPKQELYYSSGDIWDQPSYPSQQNDGKDG